MSRVIDVKQDGQIFSTYELSGLPQPIGSFNDEPVGDVRTFLGLAQLRQAYPGYEFRMVSRERKVKPPEPQEEVGVDLALPKPAQPQLGEVERAGLEHFKLLLERYNWCHADAKPTVKVQCESVASLLLELFPTIEPKLQELKARASEPRFTLE